MKNKPTTRLLIVSLLIALSAVLSIEKSEAKLASCPNCNFLQTECVAGGGNVISAYCAIDTSSIHCDRQSSEFKKACDSVNGYYYPLYDGTAVCRELCP